MATGIVETIGLAATLIVALPIGLLGLEFLFGGRPIAGGGLLVAAALVVLVGKYVPTLDDVPGMAAERAAETVVSDDEE